MDQMFHKTTQKSLKYHLWCKCGGGMISQNPSSPSYCQQAACNHPSSRDLGTIIGLSDARCKSPRILSNEIWGIRNGGYRTRPTVSKLTSLVGKVHNASRVFSFPQRWSTGHSCFFWGVGHVTSIRGNRYWKNESFQNWLAFEELRNSFLSNVRILVTKILVPQKRKPYVTLFRKIRVYYDYSVVSFTQFMKSITVFRLYFYS
jgi:hypothetical protein